MTDLTWSQLLSHPGIILILGACLMTVLPLRLRNIFALLLPLVALVFALRLPRELTTELWLMGYQLHPLYIDGLSWIFTLIFVIAAFISALYSLHNEDRVEQTTVPFYAGSAIVAVLAGDLLTLFIAWEISAISSAIIIFSGRSTAAEKAGMRYLLIHILSGLCLLLGSLLHYQTHQSLAFTGMQLSSIAGFLIFIAFAIKCAFPLLHNWLQDAYPQASPTGTVALSAFTTKLAVYCLARGYAGTESLIWIGAVMAAFPIFFAVIENDLRKVLSYSLNNQLGFMVVGVGIGTELSLNGTAAHAFCHILYKALLFMSMGAVLHRTGTVKASELGGLYKSMPWTAGFCIIGTLSISAFPLFSGFIAKGIILYSVAEQGYWLIWLVLLFVSGVLDQSGIKVPFFSFFSHDSGLRCKEAPTNMLLAMGVTALACILIGIFPNVLYQHLPYEMNYHPYTFDHVITQLQLIFFALLAFVVLIRNGWYPAQINSVNLDSDWLYRKPLNALVQSSKQMFSSLLNIWQSYKYSLASNVIALLEQSNGPQSSIARGTSVGNMVTWVSVLLSACLIIYFIY